MIKKITLSKKDKEVLSRFSAQELNKQDDFFDYRGVVIKKPWGHEYLAFQNEEVAIWILHMERGSKTSFHCHPNKKTSLTVLAGEARSTTHDHESSLKSGEGLILDKGVFHSTEALYPDRVIVMEIETPTNKQDLFRIDDVYGRQGKRYEGHEYHTVSDHSICHFHGETERFDCSRKLGECEMIVLKGNNWQSIQNKLQFFKPASVSLLKGNLIGASGSNFLAVGDSMEWRSISGHANLRIMGGAEILAVKKI